MLEKSDTSISDTLRSFNASNLDVGLIVPTETGMKKSIMDATASLREYLSDTGLHDYETQSQGPDHKVTKRAFFVQPDTLEETTASLYRPQTKNGDPRIWFGGLKDYAEPFNLLAVLVRGDMIYVVNCSRHEVLSSLARPGTPLGKIAAETGKGEDPAVAELLDMMKGVAARGFVQTLRAGDTGVGMTLETLLGIQANTRQAPDFKGIEIKAKRLKKGKGNRVTLFSQVPSWKLSPIGSAWNLLASYGYEREGRLQFYHEIDARAPNSQGFVLEVDARRDWLKQNHVGPETQDVTHVTTWEMDKLRARLRDKHPRTFWVGARSRGKGIDEEFHYIQVEYTKQPKVRNFDALIEAGVISVDYTLSEKGPQKTRDHGYLFKVHPDDFDALFPPAERHLLG